MNKNEGDRKGLPVHHRIVATERYLANPNILRGNQSPVNPNREIEQMLCSVRPRRIVTPEANRSLGRSRRV
ncbi:MAG: hypothetical protein UR81_C0018G0014 [Candidatus Levybacteria bacterium GW2011_GWB1_35_5]|nr:MAG: hypothetical protein UR81_C0018G0014 [Candidatus Levybacteria bacterium GW2011_GWB1_35_5]